jgi:YVTN family beta-propeller protein
VVANTRSGSVSVLDARTGAALHTVRLRGSRNLRHVAVAPDGKWAYVPHISERGFPATRDNIDNGWVVANRLGRVPLTEDGPREAMALDARGEAVGDVDGLALSPDGKTVAVTAAGTHELLVLRLPLPFFAFGGPGDHVEPELLRDTSRFRRIPLGGRPLAARFTPDGKRVVVANYLANALQVVDVASGKVARTVPLGGPAEPSSLARRGEAVFYDAGRSFNQWYSCGTCHVEGHTNGGNFDTFNDGRYGNPKKTLSLRGVSQTIPWTWHGWQSNLGDSVHESLVKSMQGPEPSGDDRDALLAFFATLGFAPPAGRLPDGSLPAAAARGAKVFADKGCDACHAPPTFTSPGVYTVGLESPDDAFKGFNPPSLRGVARRAPYLHDGRARTLDEVLTTHHRPSRLSGKTDLTGQELRDLVAYLKAL